jgi:hypothetical protein
MMNKALLGSLAGALLLAASFGCAHQQRGGEASIEVWADRHPQASQDLGSWVQAHPPAARVFFEWDAAHPERAHEFVTWTITHPNQPIEGFVATHPNWGQFDDIALHHRAAADTFMAWCRRHQQAAEALMSHPGGLSWAGHHLYASSWHMEEPGR